MRSRIYDNPADDPEAKKFVHGLVAAGHDPLARLQFSDWLDENGYSNAAAAQRWAANHNRRPASPNDPELVGGWFGDRRPEYLGPDRFEPHRLPSAYFDNFVGARRGPNGIDPTNAPHGRFLSSIHDDKPVEDRPAAYETAFLVAGHHTPHDENGEPMAGR